MDTHIHVGTGPGAYDVRVGHGLLGELAGSVAAAGAGAASRVAVVHAPRLRDTAAAAAGLLTERGLRPTVIELPDGEQAKTADTAARCWRTLGENGFTRTDVIVGIGGGATTDLAGFVAATWLRGVPWIAVPTTLLGMVDAAVGGKTGINTGEGKNLVGAFHPPGAVLCDLDALGTLPAADYTAGLAEVVKAGFIRDTTILDLIEADPEGARTPHGPHTRELVERAIRVKAEVVTRDLREQGPREALNYGHTLGHAIEKCEGFTWRHGEAVSVGMVFAAELARLAGLSDDTVVQRHRTVLDAVGLPLRHRGGRWPELLDAMRVDKKARGNTLRFIVLDGIGRTRILADPGPERLAAAWARVSG
ncbi:3-dehydroquinate synthase [Streptomyces achromogenes]|uniref:3-dehydroquinate synthase n=1 Tax=Streptomyces achromogenes TaxID=67255 RepID=UPI0036F551EF